MFKVHTFTAVKTINSLDKFSHILNTHNSLITCCAEILETMFVDKNGTSRVSNFFNNFIGDYYTLSMFAQSNQIENHLTTVKPIQYSKELIKKDYHFDFSMAKWALEELFKVFKGVVYSDSPVWSEVAKIRRVFREDIVDFKVDINKIACNQYLFTVTIITDDCVSDTRVEVPLCTFTKNMCQYEGEVAVLCDKDTPAPAKLLIYKKILHSLNRERNMYLHSAFVVQHMPAPSYPIFLDEDNEKIATLLENDETFDVNYFIKEVDIEGAKTPFDIHKGLCRTSRNEFNVLDTVQHDYIVNDEYANRVADAPFEPLVGRFNFRTWDIVQPIEHSVENISFELPLSAWLRTS